MRRIKLVILANSTRHNCEINSIIKNLEFKYTNITILYTNSELISKKSFFYKILLKVIFTIEKRFFKTDTKLLKKKNVFISIQKLLLDQYIFSQFSNSKFFADVIIDLSSHNINRDLLKKTRFGVWKLNYGVKENFYIGLYDCLHNKKITKAYLTKSFFSNNRIITSCIDVSYLNNKTNFWLRNKQFIIDKSLNLVSKNLNKIYYNLPFQNYKINYKKKYTNPKLINLCLYIINKYFYYFFKKINIFNKKRSLWSLHITKYNKKIFVNGKLDITKSIKIKSSKNTEWADPFVIKFKDKNYVFFENNDLIHNKGKISVGELKNSELTNIKDILNFNYHLSYPFIWKFNNDIYLIPETSAKKSIHIWKAKIFPTQWMYFKKLLKNEFCVDTTIVKDKFNNNWLLTNKSNDKTGDPNNELYVYKIIGNFKKLIPHQLNPVITDSRIARNAGMLYKSKQLFRPSQINDSTGYGIGLNINRITKLDISSYKEKIIKKNFSYKTIANTDGLHHVNNSTKYIIFDVRYKI